MLKQHEYHSMDTICSQGRNGPVCLLPNTSCAADTYLSRWLSCYRFVDDRQGGVTAMSDRPVIGISAASEAETQPFAAVIERSGGATETVPIGAPAGVLTRLGALLVSGGATSPPDDAPGLRLLRAALDADMPVLCVGRGMQLLNAVQGGTPLGEVAGHGLAEEAGDESSYHRIYIAPGSKLAAVVGSGGFVRVNSRHCQGVSEAHKSPSLLASAYSLEDGVIEALESPEHDWVIGVQFQPERRLEVPPHFDRLFQGLVERAQGPGDNDGL